MSALNFMGLLKGSTWRNLKKVKEGPFYQNKMIFLVNEEGGD